MSINQPSPRKIHTHQSHSHLQKHSNTPRARTWPQWHYVHDRGTSSSPPKAAISPSTNPSGEKKFKQIGEWTQKNRGYRQVNSTYAQISYLHTNHTHTIYQQPTIQPQDTREAHNNCLSISINHFILVWTDLGRRPARRDGIGGEYTARFERHFNPGDDEKR